MSGAGAPDFFYREAQRLGYVARSAFKVKLHTCPPLLLLFTLTLLALSLQLQLLQIQKQYKLIKPGSSVLDLGCAPGAWLQVFYLIFHEFQSFELMSVSGSLNLNFVQVACQSLGPLKNGGNVVGMDIKVRRKLHLSKNVILFFCCKNCESMRLLFISEQKVKVPPQCDLRVQTICADVLNFPRQKIRELSRQVILRI